MSKPRIRFDTLFATDDARWRAVIGRDVRADGVFYYGARTMRIYCRPICPARKPRRENAVFFASRAEAEAAGYRPCKVCRPMLAARPLVADAYQVRPAGILFVDIVGSSRLAQGAQPEVVLGLIDEFHARGGRAVARHDGVVHKHLGDGFMALFGAEAAQPDDARRAVGCGLALVDALAAWNASRAKRRLGAISAGIGVHYGMVAFGVAGGEREVIGDTVNVASRLERATRRLDKSLLVSDEAMRAVADRERGALERRLNELGPVRLPGCGAHRVWAA
jgi:class 3 adenylate cyclase